MPSFYIVATPIGNLEDITLRALRILGEVDLILCEDTRVTRKLLDRYQIKTAVESFHSHSKKPKVEKILSLLEAGKNLAYVVEFSKFVWDTIIKLVVVDYPFRLLLPATFIASVCAGIILVNIRGNLRILVFIFFTLVAIYTNRNHINANQYTNLSISSYLDLETEKTTNTFHEYLPLRTNPKLLDKPWNEILGNNLSASNLRQTTNLLYFDLEVFKETTVSIGQFYFPGQTLYLDNKITNFDVDKEGRITLVIPTGNHSLAIKYQETPLIRFSKYLTLASIVWLFMKKVRF